MKWLSLQQKDPVTYSKQLNGSDFWKAEILTTHWLHRITWNGCSSKGTLEVIWSNHNAQAGPHKASSPGSCPYGFCIPQGEKLHSCSGKSVPLLSHSHSEKVFLFSQWISSDVQMGTRVFQFVPITSCPPLIMSLSMYFSYKCYKCYLGNLKPVRSLHQDLITGCLETIKNRVVKEPWNNGTYSIWCLPRKASFISFLRLIIDVNSVINKKKLETCCI